MKRSVTFAALLVLLSAASLFFFLRGCGRRSSVPLPQPVPAATAAPQSVALLVKPSPSPVPKPKEAKPVKPAAPTAMAPPPVEIFKELIPKDIEIVRVYYAQMITGPSSAIEFDINGSGFTKEFEKMIRVESGQDAATVKDLALVTPNQIHGTLVISEKSATMVAFPRVLISGKIVFQAPEPFAVIRPGEVLNLIFTEMGESGRSGRFRVFTNLDPDMFANFKVAVSTPSIQVTDLTPHLPFLVDGTVIIGPAVGGEYGITATLRGKEVWRKDGIIRVVKPNVGQSGLIQRVQAMDGFHRPGDKVFFTVQGSGFQPQDVALLKAQVKDLSLVASSFTYVAPGRLELSLTLPAAVPEKTYGLTLKSGEDMLQDIAEAFRVVGKNWPRELRVEPELVPGGSSRLILVGRDLDSKFIAGFKVELDEPELKIGAFTLSSPGEAAAPISAGAGVKPGDYLLHITSHGNPVNPEFGSLIRVTPKK